MTAPGEPNVTAGVAEREIVIGELIDEIREAANEHEGVTTPIAQGTFALYPMPDGGLMFVTNIVEGKLAGVQHTRLPPAMLRGIAALTGVGGRWESVKGMFGLGGRKKAKEIERG